MFRFAIVITLLLLVFASLWYIVFGDNLGLTFGTRTAPVLASGNFSVDFGQNAFPKTVSDGTGFFALTNGIVTRFDNSGSLSWEHPINHLNPTFVTAGSYVAVSELRGRNFQVFGSRGLLYTIAFENDILNYHIAYNGYSAVMTGSGNGYSINIFSASGDSIKRKEVEERNLFPMSMAISSDGRVLAVSYLSVGEPVVVSYICAYYIDENDAANYTDGLFALFSQVEGEIIYNVEFIDENHLMYSSDGRFGVYEVGPGQRARHIWSKTFDNRASFVEAVSGVGVAVAFGQPLINRAGFEEGTFMVYGYNGNELAAFVMDGPITYLSSGLEAAIVGGGPLGRSFSAITYRNRVAWEYTATSDVLDFVVLDRPERVLMVTPTRMEIMEVR